MVVPCIRAGEIADQAHVTGQGGIRAGVAELPPAADTVRILPESFSHCFEPFIKSWSRNIQDPGRCALIVI
jgi:hypothetical protein